MFALFPLGSETCTAVNVSTICLAGLLPLHFPALPSAHQSCRLIRRLRIWRMPTFCATPVCLLYRLFPSFRVQQLPCPGSLPACQVQGLNLALVFFPFARYINRDLGRLTDMQLLLGPIPRILGGTECGLEPNLPTRVLDHTRCLSRVLGRTLLPSTYGVGGWLDIEGTGRHATFSLTTDF